MNPNKEPLRLGKYLPYISTAGDAICLNIAFFVIELNLFNWIAWIVLNFSFALFSQRLYGLHVRRAIPTEKLVGIIIWFSIRIFVVFIAFLYVLHFDIPFFSLCRTFLIFVSALIVWTILCKKLLWIFRNRGYNFKTAIVIGQGATSNDLLEQLKEDSGFGIKVVKVFDDPSHISGIEKFVGKEGVDIIYYAPDKTQIESLSALMRTAETNGITFTFIARLPKILSSQFVPDKVGNLPALTHTLSPLFSLKNKLLKRSLDLLVSVPFLVISPVIFLPIAIGIKMSSRGPVFFKQRRTGLYGKDFLCYKFRTMRVNADSDSRQATKDDPRKTRFGDFLRKTSLDELPQFINVAIGNMSVVGPRPHMVSQTDDYRILIDKYMIRHTVKPGITGLAQVRGFRGATSELWQMEKRVENDVEYITNWNIFLDIKIIFLTIFNQLRGEDNAY